MKRLSYNYCLNTIKEITHGWLHLNASNGGYQLEEYTEQFSATSNLLKSGTLREVWDRYQAMKKDKYDFLPEHLFEWQKTSQGEGFTLAGFYSGLQATVNTLKEIGKTGPVAHKDLCVSIEGYLSYYQIPYQTKQTPDGTLFYNPERLSDNLQPLVVYGYTLATTVKPMTDDDRALYNSLPDKNLAEHVFSKAEKEATTALYNKYVNPVCIGLAAMYMKSAGAYLTTDKRPNILQAMLQTLHWFVRFSEKGPLTYPQAADLFYSRLDAVEPMQKFIQAFYVSA